MRSVISWAQDRTNRLTEKRSTIELFWNDKNIQYTDCTVTWVYTFIKTQIAYLNWVHFNICTLHLYKAALKITQKYHKAFWILGFAGKGPLKKEILRSFFKHTFSWDSEIDSKSQFKNKQKHLTGRFTDAVLLTNFDNLNSVDAK